MMQRCRQYYCLALACVVLIAACGRENGHDDDVAATETDLLVARAAIAEYAGSLKTALQSGLRDGPVNAIDVCQARAPAIAAATGKLHDLEIGRTALRVRNPDNAPDAWQRTTLERFEQSLTAGADPVTLSAYTRTRDGRHRYMQPIMTQPVCLVCHGDQLAGELEAAIEMHYPNDEARGFRAGELRGAFVVDWGDRSTE